VASDYLRTARSLSDCADVVSIQHEYGIWGGEDGDRVIDFVRALDVPAVVTLHTVLREPSERQRLVLTELVRLAEASVVMSRSAADLLTASYGLDAQRIHVIPHGVPDLPLVEPSTVKSGLGLPGRDILLSFGLLGPGKGIELAIDALPAVVAEHPNVLLVVVGATHPNLLVDGVDTYRASLLAKVRETGMRDHVQLIDRFVGKGELTQWLEAADIFVTPYPNLGQIVSGTLSYAMGAGRAIVSTPYVYAAELLADGRGVLIDRPSPALFATALNNLLADHGLRREIGRRAYQHSRAMVWPAVGRRYRDLFTAIAADARPRPSEAATPGAQLVAAAHG
jgi:glycosyltransferase involved in cell wall biosynthesis